MAKVLTFLHLLRFLRFLMFPQIFIIQKLVPRKCSDLSFEMHSMGYGPRMKEAAARQPGELNPGFTKRVFYGA